jgi:hypothetical protein
MIVPWESDANSITMMAVCLHIISAAGIDPVVAECRSLVRAVC